MKRKCRLLILVAVIMACQISPASAWILMKVSNMAEDVTTSITKAGKKAQNVLDQAANTAVVQTIGKGFEESKAWVEQNKSKLESFSDQVQKDTEAYKKIYEDSKQAYNENIGEYSKIAEDLNNVQKAYQQIEIKIEEEKTLIQSELEAQKSTLSGQIDSCTQNMSNLQQLMQEDPANKEAYETEYNKWQDQRESLTSQINTLEKNAQQQLDSILSGYNKELSKLKSQESQLKSDLSRLAGFSTEEQSDEDALLNTANLYFLQYDEALNPERQDKIRYNRLVERRQSIIDAYSQALSQIPDLVTKNNEAEDLGYGASTMDTTAGAWGAAAQLQIDNLKVLSAYAHLLVKDLKRQTAIEMSNLTFYKLEKEQKNITEFNMDDYVYKKKGDK